MTRQTGITAITIENFKGISAPVTIPLRPITLLFGANGAGKSTIVQAIHYARELLDRNNPDADFPMAGGNAIDLGGFRNVVHKHDLNRAIKIRFEVVPDGAYGIPQLWDPIVASKDERGEIWESDISGLVESVGVEFVVKWSHEQKAPWLSELNFAYNGAHFAGIKKEFPQAVPYVNGLDADHSFLEPVLTDGDHDWAYFEFITFLKKISDDSGRVKLDQPQVVPTLTDKLPITIPSLEQDQYDGFYFWGCVELVNQLILGPVLLIHRALSAFRYLGPIRVIPERNHRSPKVRDEARWADGKAAWDTLLDQASKSETDRSPLIKEVSAWLSDQDKLALNYRLEVTPEIRVPADGELMNALTLLRREFDEKDQAWFNARVLPQLQSLRPIPCVQLFDLKNGVTVGVNDIGVGVAQVIPVAVAALDKGANLIAIEQPELHLHPAAQARLGDLFVRAAKNGKLFLLETHSELLILRLLKRIRQTTAGEVPAKELELSPDDLGVVHVEKLDELTNVTLLAVDSQGEFLKHWPGKDGFFEERATELFE